MPTSPIQTSIQESTTLQPGQILTSSYGYSMTLNKWYVVTRTTAASVWVQEICGATYNDNGMGGGQAMPTMDRTPATVYDRDGQEITAPVKRFKIQRRGDCESIWNSRRNESITIWDMKPKYHNSWD